MAGSVIAFDQDRPGPATSFGTPGVARKDLWQNRLVHCRSTAAGNVAYSWVFLDIPPGSAAVLANNLTADAHFTPDLPGSYRVQLTTNGGGPGNIQILVAAITFDNVGVLTQRGWRVPALGEVTSEDNFAGQTRGWSESFEFILADIRTTLTTLLTPVAPKPVEIPFVVGEHSVGLNAWVRVGARPVNMAFYPATVGTFNRVVKFVADLDCDAGAVSADVRLEDLTHGSVLVTGTGLTHNTTTNTDKLSVALTVGVAAGNIRTDVETQYEVYLKMIGGVLGLDFVRCTNARLVISYV